LLTIYDTEDNDPTDANFSFMVLQDPTMPSSISSYNDAVKTAFSSLTDGYIN
jgi:hypothetical protein